MVGSGTLVPDGDRGSACHHLTIGGADLLLDCGSGALHGLARAGIDWPRLSHVAVSHYHYDHVGDLPALLIAFKYGLERDRADPLHLIGPVGFGSWLAGWARALGIDFLSQSFPLELHEVAPGGSHPLGEDVVLRAADAEHSDEALCYRIDGPSASVGYTGDTGPRGALGTFFEGVDVLLAECAHPDPWPMATHLTPQTLAELAASASPRLVLISHVYPPSTPGDMAAAVRARWSGRVEPAEDGTNVDVVTGKLAVDLPPSGR